MTNDSQNKKRNSLDNVVSLSRHEFVADIEQKLAEARRLFSLRDYVPCEELLLQVMELDPRNSKAKALYDLTAIKLSRRKLYKKIVEPANKDQTPADATQSNEKIPPNEPPSEIYQPPSQPESPTQELSSSAADLLKPPPLPADSNSAPVESANQVDSMRERTIAALVELLKEKERSLQDWQDPRFGPEREGTEESGKGFRQTPFARSPEDLSSPPISVPSQEKPSQEKNEEIGQSNNESNAPAGQIKQMETAAARNDQETLQPVPENRFKIQEPEERVHSQFPHFPEVQPKGPDVEPKVVRLPDVRPFDQITPPKTIDLNQLVEEKIAECSDDLWNSEVKAISVAQIKRYLYQEDYELCALALEKIRKRFPHNSEIQGFVDNTFKRLGELQRVKSSEAHARELMFSANSYYQEGKLSEALTAVKEVLRIIPEYPQAKEFVNFVQKRLEKERKKATRGKTRYCRSCGVAVDSVSVFCFHCGHRLS